jgi:transcriptional regulator with XRE-family HTH domain
LSRNNHNSALNNVLWQSISQVLSEQGRQYSDLWDIVVRNKNTHTSWRKQRTVPTISDLEEIAAALRVSPADLLRPLPAQPESQAFDQLELPFEPGRKEAHLEIECTAAGLIFRRPAKSA